MQELSPADIKILNDFSGFLSFKPNYILWALGKCSAKIVFVDKGNQGGGTDSIITDYVRRILGRHPVEKKNMRPDTKVRTIRFASETLPMSTEGQSEVKNTVYPALMKRLPPSLIKKKMTFRNPAMTLRDPQGGLDIVIEFVSYNQEVQSQAGVQRFSVYLDEEAPKSFFEEQLPRLIAADGDLIIGLTPAENLTWTKESVFDRRRITYNSPTIIRYMKEKHGQIVQPVELTDSDADIAVIRAAMDDNPTLSKSAIEEMMKIYDDPDVIEVRRYGVFHQISGTIFKEFDTNIHRISRDKYFPDGIPYAWVHARGIDFHEKTPWACGWIALSKENEAFIYQEYNPSPEKLVTLEIVREIAVRSRDQRFYINMIDPLAEKKQVNTGLSALQDINRIFLELKREGIGTGGYWQTWDTKSTRGRDVLRERLKNSRLCGRPFNNRVAKGGDFMYLPTLWVLDTCPITIHAFKNWSWDAWASREAELTKEDKNKPQDKYSHFPIMYECLFKFPSFSIGRYSGSVLPEHTPKYRDAFTGRP